jgi:hypothetical protein
MLQIYADSARAMTWLERDRCEVIVVETVPQADQQALARRSVIIAWHES